MILQEFQAIVMAAGKGSRMTELTARRPKCLLPIGNLPMLWYPLNLLERSNFQDVLIVVCETAKNEVLSALEKLSLKIRYELVGIPVGEDWGTADSLRHLEETNKIKSDVLVLPCDLLTDVSLTPLLDLYRQHSASLCALFVGKQNTSNVTLPTPGPTSKDKAERDFVGIEPSTDRLVFIASASDYEESLSMSRSLMHRYGRISLHTHLTDAHVYLINKWLCQYLTINRSLSTLKGEVLPHVVKRHILKNNKPKADMEKASLVALDPKNDISEFSQESVQNVMVRNLSTYTDRRCHPAYNGDSIRCYAYLADQGSYLIRANTLQHYTRANREISDFWKKIPDSKEIPVHSIGEKDGCIIISDRAHIAERTTIISSIIGPAANVSTKTRVAHSLVMNGAKIGERCIIENCIICEESVIEDGCNIKDCLVGSQHLVTSGSKHCKEVLTDIERLMEI